MEAYDHVANTWTYMPNMIHGRNGHYTVSVRNKLYAFGGFTDTFEVFDSFSKKFSLLKPSSSFLYMGSYNINGAISLGSNILIFRDNSNKLIYFDFVKNEWKEESFEVTKNIKLYLCLKQQKY